MRFYLACAFLVWSFIPHFQLVYHSHAGGEAGHTHAVLSRDDAKLANELSRAFDAGAQVEDAGELDIEAVPAPEPSAEPGQSRVAAYHGGNLHGHYLEEPNLAGVASHSDFRRAPSDPVIHPPASYLSPDLAARRFQPARAPPVSLLA